METNTKKFVLFSSSRQNKSEKKKRSVKKTVLILSIIVVLLSGLYCTAMFSNIPFIEKWRDLYIETAMDTLNHKWLATFFIPGSVIDGVLSNKQAVIDAQQQLESSWNPDGTATGQLKPNDTLEDFLKLFDELDKTSFNNYVSNNPDVLINGYGNLLINKAGLNDTGTSIYTTCGDQVLAIDAANGILIVKVTGDGYVGKLAIAKFASKVKLGVSEKLGSYGQTVQKIAENNNGVLAINASGFTDNEKKGNGGQVVGVLIANGEMISPPVHSPYLTIGFSKDDHLNIGVPIDKVDYRDAVEFVPALIVNGINVIKNKNLVNGSMGFGMQPRTVIGQKADKTVLMLTIDGRQIGYSLGCTVVECANILLRYGAYQAANLDGGSSTVMYYRGQVITKPANGIDYGRYVPDAFYVEYTGTPEKAK